MSTRVLLALLLAFALTTSVVLDYLARAWTLNGSTEVGGLLSFVWWAAGPLGFDVLANLMVSLLITLVFFVLVDRLIVKPLKIICKAMEGYSRTGVREPLPPFRASPTEIRNFSRVWTEFAGKVEESHTRDVEVSRVKSDFISTAAHQLRTPLTGIRWALEALQKEPLTETQQLLIKSAVDKSHDLVGIVGTLLDISSIESGKYKYQFTSVDIEKLVTAVATDFLPLAQAAQVIITYQPTGNLPPVRLDQERMKWVLNNLIENAIRYTPAGGNVQISTLSVGGRVMVRVKDTGIGIKQEDRNNIFERFYRAGNAITKQNQGNGLGLYIARAIVRDHRGELSFEANAEGPGTTFTLALPTS